MGLGGRVWIEGKQGIAALVSISATSHSIPSISFLPLYPVPTHGNSRSALFPTQSLPTSHPA